jgi:ABC-type transporter Mla subunit MlaD
MFQVQLKIVETEKSQLQQQLTELVAHLNTFDEVQSSSRTLIITLQSERDALRARLEQISLQPKQIARVEPLLAPQPTQQQEKYLESTHSTAKSSGVSATSEHNKRSVSPLEVVKEDVAVFEHAVLLELSVLQEENAAHRELLRQMSDALTQRDQESALLRAQLQRQSVTTSRQLPITSVQSNLSTQSSRVASLASWLPPSTPKKEQSQVPADANNELDARAEQLSASLKASPVMRKVLQRQ